MLKNRMAFRAGAQVVPGPNIYPAVVAARFRLPFYIVTREGRVVDDHGVSWRAGSPADRWFAVYQKKEVPPSA
jgi:hypothetical protein